jgi:Zn-dependent protease
LLFALAQPVAFAGLLVAFLLALLLRAYAIRLTGRSLGLTHPGESVTPRLREDVDAFGAVAAAVGGAGWGKVIDVDEIPRSHGRGRAAAVFAAGPLTTIIAAQIVFLAHKLLFPESAGLAFLRPSDVLRGQFDADLLSQFVLAVAVGLLGFGLISLLPIPPLDGFGLLWSAQRRPGTGMQGYRLWFQDKNIGVVVLLVCCFFPLNYPLLLIPVDLLGTVFLRVWG